MDHSFGCNCEDCWWANGQKEVCPTCGCIVGEGCPCSGKSEAWQEGYAAGFTTHVVAGDYAEGSRGREDYSAGFDAGLSAFHSI